MRTRPRITAIICTHNRERFIRRCIQSIYQQSLEQSLYEVLVVDNGSTDSTREICSEFEKHCNFRYIYEPVLGLSQARNCGWKNSHGDYVGYLDDDAVAANSWLEKALWSFECVEPQPEWVGGPIALEWECEAPDWITDEYRTTLGWMYWGDEERFLTGANERLGGGNSFYLKSILEKMNGFDTRLGRKKNLLLSGEETQFQHRLKSLGGRLFYHPGILIDHYVAKERIEPSFFYRRYYWGGITDYIMGRTMGDISYDAIEQDEAVSTDNVTNKTSQFGRLIGNGLKSIGIMVPKSQKIQSRIYLSYVFGALVAVLRFGWRKIEGETENGK